MSKLLKIRMQDEVAMTEATIGRKGIFLESVEDGNLVYLVESKGTFSKVTQQLSHKGVDFEVIEKLPEKNIQGSQVRTTFVQNDVSKNMTGKVKQGCFYKIVDPFSLEEELITDWDQVQAKLAEMGAVAPSEPQVEQKVFYESTLGRVMVEAVRVREKVTESTTLEDELVDEVIDSMDPGMVSFDTPDSGFSFRMEKDGTEVGELTVDDVEYEPGEDEVGVILESVAVEEVLTEGTIRGKIRGRLVEGATCSRGRLVEVKFEGHMNFARYLESKDNEDVMKQLAHNLGYDWEGSELFAVHLPTGNEILFSEDMADQAIHWSLVDEDWSTLESGKADFKIHESSMEDMENFVKSTIHGVRNEDLITHLAKDTGYSIEGGGASPVYLEAPTEELDRVLVFGTESGSLGWNLINPETMEIYRDGEMPKPLSEYEYQAIVDFVKQVAGDTDLHKVTESYGDRPSDELQRKYGEYVFLLEYHDGSDEQLARMKQLEAELDKERFWGKGYPLDTDNPVMNVAKKVYDDLCKEHGITPAGFGESKARKVVEATEKKMQHSEYMKKVKHMTDEELLYTLLDAKRAANAARRMDSPNEGYYLDEVSYCGMEIKRRKDAGLWDPDMLGMEEEFGNTEVGDLMRRLTESSEEDPGLYAEPDEDSITSEDDENWYQYGKLYFTGSRKGLRAKMDNGQFWPSVFIISDHGNAHLITDFTESKNLEEAGRRTPAQNKEIAQQIADRCKELGWEYYMRPDLSVFTITKKLAPGSSEEFSQADGEWYGILSLLPSSSSGSTWGTDGSGMGGYDALKKGFFRMNKSGGNKLVLRELGKLKNSSVKESREYTGDELGDIVAVESVEVKDNGTVVLTFDPYSVRDALEEDDGSELFGMLAEHNDMDMEEVVNGIIADQGVEIDTAQRGEYTLEPEDTFTLTFSTRPIQGKVTESGELS